MRNKQGYKYLIAWENPAKLRKKIYEITKRFPKKELRRVSQMNAAARSAKQNIQEGYFRTTAEFIRGITIAMGSLGELRGDVEDCFEDELITKEEFKGLDDLCGRTIYLLSKLVDSLRKKL